MRRSSVITRARLPYDNDIPLTNLPRWWTVSFQLSARNARPRRRDRSLARPPVSTCELARINEVSRAESERIELQSHPAAHRLLFRPSDEKQSGRKSSLSPTSETPLTSGTAGVFWAVARHLPGIYPRFAYLSAPLISGSERNDRETASDTKRRDR